MQKKAKIRVWKTREKLFKATIFIIFFMNYSLNGSISAAEKEERKVFGISYEKAYLIILAYPSGTKNQYTIPKLKEFDSKDIQASRLIPIKDLNKLDIILKDKDNFEDRLEEVGLYLYVIVFFKDDRIVLKLMPNLAGGNLGAKPYLNNPKGWSQQGINRFCGFCHGIMTSINGKDHTKKLLNILNKKSPAPSFIQSPK